MASGESVWPDGKTSADWYDVAGLMMEMEQINRVKFTVTLSSEGNAKSPDLLLLVSATNTDNAAAEPVFWALSPLRFSGLRMASLKAAFLYALYQMDFLFGATEWEGSKDTT